MSLSFIKESHTTSFADLTIVARLKNQTRLMTACSWVIWLINRDFFSARAWHIEMNFNFLLSPFSFHFHFTFCLTSPSRKTIEFSWRSSTRQPGILSLAASWRRFTVSTIAATWTWRMREEVGRDCLLFLLASSSSQPLSICRSNRRFCRHLCWNDRRGIPLHVLSTAVRLLLHFWPPPANGNNRRRQDEYDHSTK